MFARSSLLLLLLRINLETGHTRIIAAQSGIENCHSLCLLHLFVVKSISFGFSAETRMFSWSFYIHEIAFA